MTNFTITSSVQSITPQLAQDILQSNTLNRPLNRSTVLDYVSQMQKGLWKLNGEPIIISRDGQLLDGQHRLQAVVESGVTIPAVIIYNVEQDAFTTIDTGRVRTAGDIFSIDGIENANQKAATISAYLRLTRKKETESTVSSDVFNKHSVRQLRVSKKEILDFYKSHKEIVDNICNAAAKCCRKARIMTQTVCSGYFLYLIYDKHYSFEKVAHFFYELYGVEPYSNKSIELYRTKIIRHLTGQKPLTPQQRNVFLIKTWNAYISGKELTVLSYDDKKDKNIDFI